LERRGIAVVLRVREITRDQVAVRLGQALRRLGECEQVWRGCREAVTEAAEQARRVERESQVRPERLSWHRRHVLEAERARAAAEEAHREASREFERVRGEWLAAQREVDALTEIHARQQEASRRERDRRAQAESDEWGARGVT